MDVLMYALEHGIPAAEAALVMDLSEQQVQRAFDDFSRKRKTTQYLRQMPIDYSSVNSENQ
jgi:NAD+ synthase